MKKIRKILVLLILSAIVITSGQNVSALEQTITLGDAPYVGERYIANVGFYHKRTTSGQELYCLNMKKTTAKNTTATLVQNSSYVDGGITYILKNGYPNKSITGNADKDYYITQTAVWWYLDETHGTTNLGDQFKNNGTVTANGQGMREQIKKLVSDAKAHRNDIVNTNQSLQLTTGNTSMTLQDAYYVSNDIKASKIDGIASFDVTLTQAPSGTKIIMNGNEINYTGKFTVNANNSFKVKVPVTALTTTSSEITVNATAQSTTYEAHEYQPTNTNMQNVALLDKTTKAVTSTVKLDISSSKVSVVKVDSETKQPLAGAKLVLKDENGNVITSWTSTINAHVIRNLANGTYTIEEEVAPDGYTLNKNITKFTIDDTHKDIQISIENAKTSQEVPVPDTASTASAILTILGIVIISSGAVYVYKTRKHI